MRVHRLRDAVEQVPDGADADIAEWAEARWVAMLDRIEHRQAGIGLRYWGPPLWLEVTMTGPDSDTWPAVSDEATSWDWQSNAPCDVSGIERAGADDAELLAVVSRYTIENLILNAVHEIGEWLRVDGERVYPAHLPSSEVTPDSDQGNGAVSLLLMFGSLSRPPTAPEVRTGPEQPRRVERLARALPPSRFTHLPGTTVSYEDAGPMVRAWCGSAPTTAWRAAWSGSTLAAVDADAPEALELVRRDVHTAVVWYEADRVCRAFHVDGRRPWSLRAPSWALGGEPGDAQAPDAASLSISVDYAIRAS